WRKGAWSVWHEYPQKCANERADGRKTQPVCRDDAMNSWLIQQRAALALALRRLADTPTITLLAAISIGVALSLPAGGHLLLRSLQQLGQGNSATPQISVFMALDADDKASDKVGEQLKIHPGVGKVEFVSREATQKRLREAGLAQVIDSLPHNPFPDTFVITPRDTT